MKKINLLIILIILSSLPIAIAQESEEVDEEQAGITPDSIWWGIDRAFERIKMALTFSKEGKIRYGLERASERLAELRLMERINNSVAFQKAREKYDESIEEVRERTEGMPERIKLQVQEQIQKHVTTLEQVRERVEAKIREGKMLEIAKQGIENAINKSKQVIERFRGG